MEPVENNFSVGQCFTEGQIRAAHLHRHGLPLFPSSCQTFQKTPNVLAAPSFIRVQDSAGTQVGDDSHTTMAHLEAEFANADNLHFVQEDMIRETFPAPIGNLWNHLRFCSFNIVRRQPEREGPNNADAPCHVHCFTFKHHSGTHLPQDSQDPV